MVKIFFCLILFAVSSSFAGLQKPEKSFVCLMIGETQQKRESIVLEKRYVMQKSLLEEQKDGRRGVYFDVFGTGAFNMFIQKEKKKRPSVIVKFDSEEQGVLQARKFMETPTHIEQKLSVIAQVKKKSYKFESFRLDCFKNIRSRS